MDIDVLLPFLISSCVPRSRDLENGKFRALMRAHMGRRLLSPLLFPSPSRLPHYGHGC